MASDYSKYIQEFNATTSKPKAKSKSRAAWRDADIKKHLPKIVGALVVFGAITMAWAFWPEHVPAVDAAPSEIAKYVGSPRFLALPADKRKPYLDVMQEKRHEIFSAATDPQREQMRLAVAAQMLSEYFALAPGEARDAYLDKMRVRQEANRQRWRDQATTQPTTAQADGRPPGGPGGPGRPPGGPQDRRGGGSRSPVQQASRIESVPPGIQAGMAQMMADMRARRAAQGH